MSLEAMVDNRIITVSPDMSPIREAFCRDYSDKRLLECPDTGQPMIFKNGPVRGPYFSLYNPETGAPESEMHSKVKGFLHDLIPDHNYIDGSGTEVEINGRIYDVYFEFHHSEYGLLRTGIEVQHSHEPKERLIDKLEKSTVENISVMYVLTPEIFLRKNDEDGTMNTRVLERQLHHLYGGRLYYCDGKGLFSLHLEDLPGQSRRKRFKMIDLLENTLTDPSVLKLRYMRSERNEEFPCWYRLRTFNDADWWRLIGHRQ